MSRLPLFKMIQYLEGLPLRCFPPCRSNQMEEENGALPASLTFVALACYVWPVELQDKGHGPAFLLYRIKESHFLNCGHNLPIPFSYISSTAMNGSLTRTTFVIFLLYLRGIPSRERSLMMDIFHYPKLTHKRTN
ncbi:Hypothetical predicted protein [Podarcis lilfordi]|uniref:Uncharacterized protein n=1 Tax=Podarcis lilfordi TaxID=74358 RepID=A0AA35PNZ3_9SAUR|nr:Hypothetical predicted protein [Podarcis lilfordi]